MSPPDHAHFKQTWTGPQASIAMLEARLMRGGNLDVFILQYIEASMLISASRPTRR